MKLPSFVFNDDLPPADNYPGLGQSLAKTGGIFRHADHAAGGLLLVRLDGTHAVIDKSTLLSPIIADRLRLSVIKRGKPAGCVISAAHLNAILRSELFLSQFKTADLISSQPLFLPDWSLTKPGFNNGGPRQQIVYTGNDVPISNNTDTMSRFLDVMDFHSNADRTNTVAAALTVMLRNFWPGGKPLVAATATKSFSGKDTVLQFVSGTTKLVSSSYSSADFALEHKIVDELKRFPDTGLVVIDNARTKNPQHFIESQFVERSITEPLLHLGGYRAGPTIERRNDIVFAISTNMARLCRDLLNRTLLIHLAPTGNVQERKSEIGNPRQEFLPNNREAIAAELRGMVVRWKDVGSPLHETASHAFSPWAKTIGGILQVEGLSDFLGNRNLLSDHDPVSHGIAELANANPNRWMRPGQWAACIIDRGLMKTLLPVTDRENEVRRAQAVGELFSRLVDESFISKTEGNLQKFVLEKRRSRENGKEAKTRYRFRPT